jgi:hypothetical protein
VIKTLTAVAAFLVAFWFRLALFAGSPANPRYDGDLPGTGP